jgi:hypothetical protein
MSDHPLNDQSMGGNPMDRVPAHDQVSFRAVLVHEGEDPHAALAAAGIVDAVALPVVIGEEVDLGGGLLGDGRTPNVTAVLETEQEDAFEEPAGTQPGSARPADDENGARPSGSVARNLPAAFGMQPLAPVRSRGG